MDKKKLARLERRIRLIIERRLETGEMTISPGMDGCRWLDCGCALALVRGPRGEPSEYLDEAARRLGIAPHQARDIEWGFEWGHAPLWHVNNDLLQDLGSRLRDDYFEGTET